MLERSLYRRIINTRSAGRQRIITVFYSPLNLRHELDYMGQTIKIFGGPRKASLADALAEAAKMVAELRKDDAGRLKSL